MEAPAAICVRNVEDLSSQVGLTELSNLARFLLLPSSMLSTLISALAR